MARLDAENVHLLEDRKLHALWEESLKDSADAIHSRALIYVEWCARGVDVSFVPKPNALAYELVAAGQLVPEAALAFGSNERRLRLMATLGKADQLRVVGGKEIAVVKLVGDRVETEMVYANLLPFSELEDLIVDGRLLSEHEQRARLKGRNAAAVAVLPTKRRVSIALDERVHARLLRQADAAGAPLGAYIADLLDWASQGQEIGTPQDQPARGGSAA